jgi:ComF family protein
MAYRAAKQFLHHALNIALPSRCVRCADFVEKPGSVCGVCWQEMDFIAKPFCTQCGMPFAFDEADDALLCGGCISDAPAFDVARSALRYNDKSRGLITGFKYSDKLHAARLFSGWMTQAGKACLEGADMIVPVPLHRVRLFTRRYNQSALLAQHIARQSGLPFYPRLIKRLRNSAPQASLSRSSRLTNVKGIFTVLPPYDVGGKHVVLVDDVMTTGATVRECAKALKKAGAASVRVLVLARTTEDG